MTREHRIAAILRADFLGSRHGMINTRDLRHYITAPRRVSLVPAPWRVDQ